MDSLEHQTFFGKLLCSRVFMSGAAEINEKIWKEEAYRLLTEQETVFFNYRGMLTFPQWSMLKAIALEGELFEPTANEFVAKHSLGSPSTVLRSLQALLRMELIYFDYTSEGKKYFKINDLLFRRWVESRE